MKSRRPLIVVLLLIAILSALVLPAAPVCRDWAYIDRHTGSRKGHRDWAIGLRSGAWYQESALEAFMRSRHPADFRQDWVSYAGTGRNIFGKAIQFGHGQPGPIVVLSPNAIRAYSKTATPTEMRRLYDVFASGDQAKVRELVDQIGNANPQPEGDSHQEPIADPLSPCGRGAGVRGVCELWERFQIWSTRASLLHAHRVPLVSPLHDTTTEPPVCNDFRASDVTEPKSNGKTQAKQSAIVRDCQARSAVLTFCTNGPPAQVEPKPTEDTRAATVGWPRG